MQTAPTTDREFRISFFRILLKKLMDCKKDTKPEELEIIVTGQEQRVIEYYVKDVSRRPVHEDTSHAELANIFIEKIILLRQGDFDEWEEFRQMKEDFKKDITAEEVLDFDSLVLHFTK